MRYGHTRGKSTSPWTIIGWIILIALAIPLATCVGVLGSVASH